MNVASDSIDDQSNWGNVEEEVDWGIHDSCKDFLVVSIHLPSRDLLCRLNLQGYRPLSRDRVYLALASLS